ncbi:hypothetical protein J3Q64DRAFT_1696642 [Phycomyces blakesleeanus]|uniref:DUF155 domain-containing protein n=2 Tax=Phycomyces blakesleeanus TaxID=4837 RepID=A0A162UHQ3_PHYB8|nr:hypothetical protein PHYBLDRAFT_186235 [Phycomyces blakesleeanus NRRL 1555(-)]OAD76322.1 hypothetical protein PHYBLDRAFT_186235 [Phycomyces blakesleeanus NRRL 1555(-)]|eukprot:XP_018294362.1 hypothetical protein PHYBLDRAFT_186235 [Phycomyces blakesleeanus NRRL 1555(-)]
MSRSKAAEEAFLKQQASGSHGPVRQSRSSAISKQVLKNNPIPQTVHSSPNLLLPNTARVKANQPLRSTKVSQKLVLFPQASTEAESTMQATLPIDGDYHFVPDHEQQGDHIPFEREVWREQPQGGVPLPVEWTFGSRTAAERMTKDERDLAILPRVAAYCTGDGYDLDRLRPFLREHHHVTPRLYDECLYAAYHFPLRTLRPGKDNFYNIRVRSSAPVPAQTPVEEQEMNYDEDHYQQDENVPEHGRSGHSYPENYDRRPSVSSAVSMPERQLSSIEQNSEPVHAEHMDVIKEREEDGQSYNPDKFENYGNGDGDQTPQVKDEYLNEQNDYFSSQQKSVSAPVSPLANMTDTPGLSEHPPQVQVAPNGPPKKPFTGGEIFIFDYGVVVFWNFRRAEELLTLEDLAPFSVRPFRDNPDEDMQIEEMHFQYDTSQLKPRIFNDMITLKTGNHMIKLTLSHGLSQSAVLARYEDIMDKTIEDTKHLPKEMAQTGRLDKNRTEITKINGQLFNLRMNVNLVSNVLDTPEIFWSEPALQPMYNAIRDYLEVPQRAQILNDRLRVISDLLSMLRDHLTNFGVEYQTLIIIYLIIVAVIVACFEIAVKIMQSIEVV